VAVEGKRSRDPLAAHDRKADGIRERQGLIGETSDPAHCGVNELIVERNDEVRSRFEDSFQKECSGARSAPTQKERLRLRGNKRRGYQKVAAPDGSRICLSSYVVTPFSRRESGEPSGRVEEQRGRHLLAAVLRFGRGVLFCEIAIVVYRDICWRIAGPLG